eukprot:scaffold7774_cov430-Prasinococcus_capsulatus_cf.AAC.2
MDGLRLVQINAFGFSPEGPPPRGETPKGWKDSPCWSIKRQEVRGVDGCLEEQPRCTTRTHRMNRSCDSQAVEVRPWAFPKLRCALQQPRSPL